VDTPEWKALVSKWRAWEESFDFIQAGHDKKKLDGVKDRPAAVQWWISRGRQGKLPIGDLWEFSINWWKWWIQVNPEWREKTEDGRLKTSGDGPWDKLKISGVNGVLSPPVCLCWWFSADDNVREDARCSSAVTDMTWVLDGLL
ncbi:hypothetical protein C8J56DRAFT_749503, partial [Mycena floridula]